MSGSLGRRIHNLASTQTFSIYWGLLPWQRFMWLTLALSGGPVCLHPSGSCLGLIVFLRPTSEEPHTHSHTHSGSCKCWSFQSGTALKPQEPNLFFL